MTIMTTTMSIRLHLGWATMHCCQPPLGRPFFEQIQLTKCRDEKWRRLAAACSNLNEHIFRPLTMHDMSWSLFLTPQGSLILSCHCATHPFEAVEFADKISPRSCSARLGQETYPNAESNSRASCHFAWHFCLSSLYKYRTRHRYRTSRSSCLTAARHHANGYQQSFAIIFGL